MTTNIFRCEGCEQLIDKNGVLTNRMQLTGLDQVDVYWIDEYVTPDSLAVDHIEPVAPLSGLELLYNEYWATSVVTRQFAGEKGLQYLCGCCHYFKTQIENDIRRANKKMLKGG